LIQAVTGLSVPLQTRVGVATVTRHAALRGLQIKLQLPSSPLSIISREDAETGVEHRSS
jgi:hypothetical protein